MKQSFKKSCFRVLLLSAAFYLLAGIGCASFQRKLIYFPTVCTAEKAQELASAGQLERWTSGSGKALGWKRLSRSQPAKGQVLVTHGNACDAFQCGHYADVIQEVAPFDVYLLEYPGYADCAGAPSEAAIDAQANEGFQCLSTNLPIYLVGESLGTGVAAYLGGHFGERVSGVALLAPYNCLCDVAQAHIRIFPARWILCDRFPSGDYLRTYHGPLAVVLGGKDTVVPPRFGKKLYEGYQGPKRLWESPEADHNNLMFQSKPTWAEMLAFLANKT